MHLLEVIDRVVPNHVFRSFHYFGQFYSQVLFPCLSAVPFCPPVPALVNPKNADADDNADNNDYGHNGYNKRTDQLFT